MRPLISAATRRLVWERARGCCEYCRIPESITFALHEVDHIVALKHGGGNDTDNLALCCTICNKHKGSDLTSIDPKTGRIVRLFHPRRDHWSKHFYINGAMIAPRTAISRVTIYLLQLNRTERLSEREFLIAAGLFVTSE